MYQVRNGKASVIMEAVATKDLWIYHAFIGTAGSCNDINVLDRSPLVSTLMEGLTPPLPYTINGIEFTMPYLLADGICPNWPIFLETIAEPQGAKRKQYAQIQEAVRKDVALFWSPASTVCHLGKPM